MTFLEWINKPIFIRGIPPWEHGTPIRLPVGEISVSLHREGLVPLRPYGYIIAIRPGAVIAAFDRDVCSDKNGDKKCISQQTAHKKYRNYQEYELEELLNNTRLGKHNEIWIDTNKADIIGAYITEVSPGWRQFQYDMQRAGISIQKI